MLNTVIVMCKRCAGVIRWINIDTFNLACELMFERFKGKEIIAEDEAVVEEVLVSHAVRRVVGLLWVFQQNTRLQLGPVLFANPGQFEFLFAGHGFLYLFVFGG